MKKPVLTIIIFLVSAIFLIAAPGNDYYFKINKSFDVFGAIFREISANYVLNIDPEELVGEGINGMLGSLDPYSAYIDQEHQEDIDIITTGSYIGLGITVAVRDSMLTIVNIHDGFVASRSGIRVGDRIYKIDTNIVIYSSNDDLRRYTNGKAGESLNIWLLRDGIKDTLKFTLRREEIKISNVSYNGMINDSTGYIKIDHFARKTADEVRYAYNELSRDYHLKGLIIDLRNNPGGLLESAIATCELFVPKGDMIVSTKGRDPRDEHSYRAESVPMDKNIRLAILINNHSASASEIVAGAIQDLDRGIVVGQRSFGKGLVQSVFDLPYYGNLKLTTAKYYTPSGRCIQKIDYDRSVKPKPLIKGIFKTLNGRPVVESKGIIPDSSVSETDYPDYIDFLMKNDVFFGFASDYTSQMDSMPVNFRVDSKVLSSFYKYLDNKNITYNSVQLQKLKEIKNLSTKEGYSKKVLKDIDDLESAIKAEEKNYQTKNELDIMKLIYNEIYSRFNSEHTTISMMLKGDNCLKTATELLSPEIYNKLLLLDKKSDN